MVAGGAKKTTSKSITTSFYRLLQVTLSWPVVDESYHGASVKVLANRHLLSMCVHLGLCARGRTDVRMPGKDLHSAILLACGVSEGKLCNGKLAAGRWTSELSTSY